MTSTLRARATPKYRNGKPILLALVERVCECGSILEVYDAKLDKWTKTLDKSTHSYDNHEHKAVGSTHHCKCGVALK